MLRPYQWKHALIHAWFISALITGLFYKWFALDNRYAVFLYGHHGAGPFDNVTRSRYWMAGLVACGITLLVYGPGNWLIKRLRPRYRLPGWWQVWILCAPMLAVSIIVITMSFNHPTLPLENALHCAAVTLIVLPLALMPSLELANDPVETAWRTADGIGLTFSLLLIRAVELPSRGVDVARSTVLAGATGSILAGAVWLGLMTVIRQRFHRPASDAHAILLAGLAISYLLIPVVHYQLFTPPGTHYISSSTNFFAESPIIQAIAMLAAAMLARVTTWIRRAHTPKYVSTPLF